MEEAQKAAALEKKALGNDSFKAGNFEEAIAFFTEGIELDQSNPNFFCNRAMANFSLMKWNLAGSDAHRAIMLSDKYVKAYFWLVKAQVHIFYVS